MSLGNTSSKEGNTTKIAPIIKIGIVAELINKITRLLKSQELLIKYSVAAPKNLTIPEYIKVQRKINPILLSFLDSLATSLIVALLTIGTIPHLRIKNPSTKKRSMRKNPLFKYLSFNMNRQDKIPNSKPVLEVACTAFTKRGWEYGQL